MSVRGGKSQNRPHYRDIAGQTETDWKHLLKTRTIKATWIERVLYRGQFQLPVAYDDHCVVVEGVVSPGGQGGWLRPGGGYDVHSFALAGWRLPGKPLVERELTLLRPVPPSRDSEDRRVNWFDRFPSYSIQRLSVLLSRNQTRAVVEKVLTFDRPDEALLSFSNRLRQPVVISTERFGDLVLNPTFRLFEGSRNWNGKTVDLTFDKCDDGGIGDAIMTAERLWSDQAAWKRRVDAFAVEKLLPLKNEDYLRDGEAELTAEDFKARMELKSINLEGDGQFEFSHYGDLFWGHPIQIRGNLADGLTDADVPG